MPNRFMPIGPGTGQDAAYNQINKNFAQLDREAVTKVFNGPNGVNALIEGRLPNDNGYGFLLTDPTNTPRVILHFDADGNPVFKISESGVDVTTATDDELNFNSSQNVFKITQRFTLNVSVPGNPPGTYNSYSAVRAHGLGFQPAYAAYVDSSLGGRAIVPHVEYVAIGVPPGQYLEPAISKSVIVDGTNVTALVETTANLTATFSFTVYLLQETAN